MVEDNDYPKLEQIHSKRTSTMTRRRLLSTLLGVGFSATAAGHLTTDDLKAAATDQIPIVEGFSSDDPKKPVETFTAKKRNVPVDWYNDLQQARKVKEDVLSTYGGLDDVIGIGVKAGTFGGDNASVQVDVLPTNIAESRGTLPETVDEVPIEVNEGSEITPDACNTGDFDYIIPGGVRAIGDDSDGYGTMMSQIYDHHGRQRFATARHLYSGGNANGRNLWHPSKSKTPVGEVVRAHCYDDLVLAVSLNGHAPQRRIEDANPELVNGQFSRDGLSTLQANGERVLKVGCRTCKTGGQIHNVNYTHFGYGCTPKHGQVRWGSGNDSKGGDSGAPVYHQNPNNSSYQWIVSLDLWSGSNATGGTGAWRIKNRHNYHF